MLRGKYKDFAMRLRMTAESYKVKIDTLRVRFESSARTNYVRH